MAKKREPSKHSRAARRATSPGIDLDKSLKDFKPPARTSVPRPSVLAAHQSAGIHKKARRGRHLSAKAKRRHEKGVEMAEAVLERTGKKVQRSLGRERNIKERSKNWEAVNKAADGAVATGIDAEDASDRDAKAEDDKAWETDEDMDGDAKVEGAPPTEVSEPAVVKTTDEDDDEIL